MRSVGSLGLRAIATPDKRILFPVLCVHSDVKQWIGKFVCDFQLPRVARLEIAIHILKNLAGHYRRFFPRGVLVGQFLAVGVCIIFLPKVLKKPRYHLLHPQKKLETFLVPSLTKLPMPVMCCLYQTAGSQALSVRCFGESLLPATHQPRRLFRPADEPSSWAPCVLVGGRRSRPASSS